MRIGIDGRVLLDRKTGDRTYAKGLLHGLLQLAERPELVVMLNHPPDQTLQSRLPGVEFAVASRPRGYLWTLIALPRLAAQAHVDLLHVQYMTPFRAPCPVITTVHDISFRLHPAWFPLRHRLVMNTFIPRSIRSAAAVITPSEATADDIRREYGPPLPSLHVTPYATGPEFLLPPVPERMSACINRLGIVRPYMLYVGNLQPRKNVAGLLRSFVEARERARFEHRLLIVGQQGWRCGAQMRALHDAEAAGHAIHAGYVDDADLPALYAGADAFLFPTLMEGFGLPVLEAMGVGTPVLTSSVSSLPEVAGDAALLVNPADERAITEAIEQLAADGALRARLREAGLKRAAQFSWHRTARMTLEVYERAAAER